MALHAPSIYGEKLWPGGGMSYTRMHELFLSTLKELGLTPSSTVFTAYEQVAPQQQPMQVYWTAFLRVWPLEIRISKGWLCQGQPGGTHVSLPKPGVVMLYLAYPSFGDTSVWQK